MPRPKKWRNVCCLPKIKKFGPLGRKENIECITMSVEEYETIRLIDLQGKIQEECAKQMNIARTTVQSIYNEARKKIADSIINGKILLIEGGDYKICEGNNKFCGQGKCCRCYAEEGKANEFFKQGN